MRRYTTPHDTGIIEDSAVPICLRLVRGSAQKYLTDRAEAEEKFSTPRLPSLLTIFIGIPALIGGLVAIGIPGHTLLPWPWTMALLMLGLALILGGIAWCMSGLRNDEARQRATLKAIDEEAGAASDAIDIPMHRCRAGVARVGERKIVRSAMEGVTPEVRDRLIALLDNGHWRAAEEAVNTLMLEAEERWLQEHDRLVKKEKEARASAAQEALGRA